MALTQEQETLLRHTLGANAKYLKKDWGFRNHFCSTPGTEDHKELVEMEKLGLVKSCSRFDGVNFWATREGAKAVGFKPYQLRNANL